MPRPMTRGRASGPSAATGAPKAQENAIHAPKNDNATTHVRYEVVGRWHLDLPIF